VLFFVVLLGSGVGWAVRDRAAREAEEARVQAEREAEAVRQQAERRAKVGIQVESVFAEVDRLEKEQKWSEALMAARRAESAVAGGEADAATVERVRLRLKDLEFIDRLDQIRMQQSTAANGEFDYAGANRQYTQAFRDYGVDIDDLAVETSIDRLRARPALVAPLAAALDFWVNLRRFGSGTDAGWKRLVAVASGIDPNPLRGRLRSAWGQPVSSELQNELRQVARSIDVRAQPPVTLELLAVTLQRVGDSETAVRLLRDAQHIYPGDFWLSFRLAGALSEQRDYEGAISYRTAAVALRPQAAAAHNNLGNAMLELKRVDEAIAAYRMAIEVDPKLPSAHYNLGNALRDQKKLPEAIKAYLKAIELKPDVVWAYGSLGRVLHDQKKLDEALAVYRKAIDIDPKSKDAAGFYFLIGKVFEDQGKLNETVAGFNVLGTALCGQNKLDEAIDAYRKALELEPKLTQAHSAMSGLAIYYASRGRPAKALPLIDELLARADTQTIPLCVQHFRRLGDPASCRAATAALEKRNPEDTVSLYNAACCRALTAAAYTKAGGPDAARLAKEEADRAMAWLTKAAAGGFSDAAQLGRDDDLDALRDREDFRKLRTDVVAKATALARARNYIRVSQWDQAAGEYSKADLGASRPSDDAFAYACLFLIRGDGEGYDCFCRDLIRRAGQTVDHFEAYALARICASARKSPVDPARAVRWANQAVTSSQPPWYFHVLGLAQYRAGQYEQSLQSFARANETELRTWDLNWFGLALAHHRLGHADEARRCLAKGVQWLEREGPPGPGRPTKILPQDWLEAQLLRREAEDLIDPKSKEK
jgi:superkiller protein 3